MFLRPYQTDAVDAVMAAYDKGRRSVLIVLPTGCGKTVTFAELAGRVRRITGKRVMVVAHREELIHQAADKIHKVTGMVCDIEMAERRADGNQFWQAPVVVASVQTLGSGKRMARFDHNEFGLLIIDEAHHATAESYRKVVEYFQSAKVLGVTATPDRSDEEALGQIFEECVYQYEVENAIKDGYLVPIVQRQVHVEGLDFSQVRTTAGDLNGAELAAVMEREQNIHKIVSPLIREAGPYKTLVFASSVVHADAIAEVLNRHRPNAARTINGMTAKDIRKSVLEDYTRNKFQFLVNVGVFTEGFDEPRIEMIAMARPTKSRSLYTQMVGRGTRPLPGLIDHLDLSRDRRDAIANSNKNKLIVLDFVGNSGKHRLMTTMDVLGGKHTDEAKRRALLVAAAAQKAGKVVTVTEALAEAEKQLNDEAERERKRLEELARKKRVRAAANYKVSTVDPFQVFGIERNPGQSVGISRAPSQKMIDVLLGAGVLNAETLGFDEASKLIEKIQERRRRGLCTYKQASQLRKRGIDPTDMSMGEAGRHLDQIAQREGWGRKKGVTA